MRKTLTVQGMTCENCVKRVKKIIEKAAGVSEVNVNLTEKEATFLYDPAVTDIAGIVKAINDFGFAAAEK